MSPDGREGSAGCSWSVKCPPTACKMRSAFDARSRPVFRAERSARTAVTPMTGDRSRAVAGL